MAQQFFTQYPSSCREHQAQRLAAIKLQASKIERRWSATDLVADVPGTDLTQHVEYLAELPQRQNGGRL